MKKLILYLVAAIFVSMPTYAQLSKKIVKYHDQKGVTLTLLNQDLYNLYKKDKLSAKTQKMLQNLEEIYTLNIDLRICSPDISKEIDQVLQHELNNSKKYQLVNSKHQNNFKQYIYVRQKKDSISDFIFYVKNQTYIQFIELRGKILIEEIALLPKTLNLPEFQRFNFINTTSSTTNIRQHPTIPENSHSRELSFFYGGATRSAKPHIESNKKAPNKIQTLKPQLNIVSRNSKPIFILDGIEKSQEEITNLDMNQIRCIYVSHDSTTSPIHSYIFLHSKNKIGSDVSYYNHILTFKYNQRLYQYDLRKIKKNNRILYVNGKLTDTLTIKPSTIRQIRPIAKLEKKHGSFGNAEVIIYTD